MSVFGCGQGRVLPHPFPGHDLGFPQEGLVPGEVGEAEDGIPAVLLGPEEIPLPPDLQVGPGDLETVGGGLEDLQSLLGHLTGSGDEDSAALIGPPPHPSPELVELG